MSHLLLTLTLSLGADDGLAKALRPLVTAESYPLTAKDRARRDRGDVSEGYFRAHRLRPTLASESV